MKRPEPDSAESRRRSQRAAEWLVRRDRGCTPAEQDEFLEWLAADPRHGEWIALHRAVLADFTALAEWRPEHSREPNPDLLAPARRRIRWLIPAALAAGIAIVFGIGSWHDDRSTHAGPPARRLLQDGSAVELNRGAIVHDSFNASERRVELVSGEAFFSVTKDPERPFVVHAGGVGIRAVGTAFRVRLEAGQVEVLVAEGRVDVHHEMRREATTVERDAAATFVDAGHRAVVSLADCSPPEVTAAAAPPYPRRPGAPVQLLDFSSAPLAVAVAEFNHRNRIQFEIADADLAAMPVVASIRSDNVEGFAQFLATAPGVHIERRGDTLIIVRRKR